MILAGMIITGLGIGSSFIGSIMSAQNVLSAKDIGSGTGALLVLRSVGGASGSSLTGAIIALGLIAFEKTEDVPVGRHGAAASVEATRSGLGGMTSHLGWSFGMVYAVAAVFAAISLAVMLWMPNSRLREMPHFLPLSE